jgi:DNA repair protein RadC
MSLVHPREVFKNAIRRNAASMVLVHNHPSGDPSPSDEDIEITKRLVEAGKVLGITVFDHVIVSRSSFVSLREICPGWFL